jgi:ATP-binding cassette subfamily B protein/subfamily B ATP-binding cassette protein MsbA
MLVGVGLNVLKPWPLKLIVDYVLIGQPLPDGVIWLRSLPGGESRQQLLTWLAGGTIALFLATEMARISQTYLETRVGNRIAYDLGAVLFDHLQRLSLRFHVQQWAGDLVRRVTIDSYCVQGLVMKVFLPVLTSLIRLVAMFAVMWQLDRTLSLIALFATPLIGLLIRLFNKPMADRTYEHQRLEGEMMALSEQTLTALPLIQSFGREAHEDQRFHRLAQQALRAYLHAILAQVQFKVGVGSVTALGTALIMLIGGFQALNGSLSIGSLLVFLAYLASLYAPMETLAYISSGYATAAAGARRVLEILDVEEKVQDAPGAKPLRRDRVRGHIRLEQVSFGYETDAPVLHHISLEARPGETLALVGATGAGKSTLAALIPRFFDPWQGCVLFDDIDVRQIQLTSLRAQIALVLQEPFLLPLTVAQNIAYARPTATRSEIVAASEAANAEEFIQRLPQGYDTVLGERGATLSGGQKQRLAIARALLKDAPVLILDEPTAALDAHTEALLLEALERLMTGRTTLIIAHRLSTIRKADQIVVLDRGKIVEMGTHQQLLTRNGYYHRLYSVKADTANVP